MTTFDIDSIRGFTDGIHQRVQACQSGEGTFCLTLDASLRFMAGLCDEYCDAVRAWGREVFTGKIVWDVEVDRILQGEGRSLFDAARHLDRDAKESEYGCYVFEGFEPFRTAYERLRQFLNPWVSPRLSVAPSPRGGLVWDEANLSHAAVVIERLRSAHPLAPTT